MKELPDRIGDTFKDRTVFITGSTGFVGKVLLEKLLRSTEVKKIYLLIRRKKGKSHTERIQDIFNNMLFKPLTEQKPDAKNKCVAIQGDVSEIDLGISPQDRKTLTDEVDFIFHCAATTRFDHTLKDAIIMNARGTKLMLDLAEECKHLKLFVHVSTAYEAVTYEKLYDPPADPHEVLNSISWIKEDTMRNFTKNLLGDIPNSYTFSKALAESLVYERLGKIPFIITRPAIVVPTYRDPFPGWCNSLNGPMGLFVGAGKGVIRSMYMDYNTHANFVPADCTVSGMLAASWNYLNFPDSPNIINLCVPEKDIKINWGELIFTGYRVINESVPFNNILWYPGGTITTSKLYNNINFVLFQLIPALFIDLLLIVLGYKPILYNIQMRIRKGSEMFEYYTVKEWNFSTKNIEAIRSKLNERENEIYVVQSDVIDVEKYLTDCILVVRRSILKETDDMLPAARRNMKIMYVLNIVTKTSFLSFFMCLRKLPSDARWRYISFPKMIFNSFGSLSLALTSLSIWAKVHLKNRR
ncbi:hypothetical protein NQ318_005839 [Aromia moschata]|uniref:Fatty acyl-CoA reductase n=1 Tax=Aromia moschata TaxID=1265417 RepID=A0AAV8YUD0_9CUCU|nr:hypothetical protein NQ318_005839 [Aromia moschata]